MVLVEKIVWWEKVGGGRESSIVGEYSWGIEMGGEVGRRLLIESDREEIGVIVVGLDYKG